MARFRYEAATREGAIERGALDAASEAGLELELAERGLYVIGVYEAGAGPGTRDASGGRRGGERDDAMSALRYVVSLLEVGTPLDRALDAARDTSRTEKVAAAIDQVRERVRKGDRLAEAMADHPRLFPPTATALAAAGEWSGRLAAGLADGIALAERERALKARVLTNLAYPGVVLAVAAGVIALLVGFVLPRFAELFREAGSALPLSTRVLLGGSRILTAWWPLWATSGAVLVGSLVLHLRTESGTRRLARLVSGIPIVRLLARQYTAVRVGSALAAALRAGIPLSRALGGVAEAMRNSLAGDRLRACLLEVRKGRSFAEALRAVDLVPDRFVRMVEMGEDVGRVDEVLERAVESTQGELTRRLDLIVRLLEPAMIILLGGVLGFVALALLQALYRFQAVPL